MGYLLLASYWP